MSEKPTYEELKQRVRELEQAESERKQPKAALRESEGQFKSLVSNIPAIIYRCKFDKAWTMLYMNAEVERICGYPSSHFINNSVRTYESIIHRDDTAFVDKSVKDCIKTDQNWDIEYRIIHKDGRAHWVHEKGYAVVDDTGAVQYLDGFISDINELRMARLEKERTAMELTQLIDTANAPIFGVDIEGNINEWNQIIARITGYGKDEVEGKNLVKEYITDEYKAPVKEVLDKALKGEETDNYEVPLFTKGGDRIMVLLNATSRRDANGNIAGVVGVGQDITEIDAMRSEMERTSTELTQLIDTANAPIFGVDTDGNINEWNQMVARITGYGKDEVESKNLVKGYITDEYKAPVKEVLDKALKGEETDNYQVPIFTKDRRRVMVLLNATTRRDAEGNIIGVVGVGQDITALRQHQENLERTVEERVKELNCLYDISKLIEKPDTSLDEILQGAVDLIPPAWHYPEVTCARITFRNHEFKSKTFREGVSKQTSDIIVRGERTGSVEASYVEKMPEMDEGPFLMEERNLINAIAEHLGIVIEKKRAEEELEQALLDTEHARDKIDGILKTVADGLIVTDPYNRIVLLNQAAEDLLGVRLTEVIGRPIDFAIKEKELRDRVKETLDKKTTGYQFDFEQLGDDPKHPRIMRARTSVVHDYEDKEVGIVTILQDVTYEREVDRMKTDFLSIAAHELRTPMTSVLGSWTEIIIPNNQSYATTSVDFVIVKPSQKFPCPHNDYLVTH